MDLEELWQDFVTESWAYNNTVDNSTVDNSTVLEVCVDVASNLPYAIHRQLWCICKLNERSSLLHNELCRSILSNTEFGSISWHGDMYCLMTPGISGIMFNLVIFLCLQITRSDTRVQVKRAASLVLPHVSLIFLRCLVGMYGLAYSHYYLPPPPPPPPPHPALPSDTVCCYTCCRSGL